jgi:TatD DNase family protein
LFDSHCHLHDARVADVDGVIARARAAGVRGFLLAGVDPDGWRHEDALRRAHGDVLVAYGVHPQRIDEAGDEEADRLVAALEGALADRPHAIGEIGLDGLGDRARSLERQARAFRAQLSVARAQDLPVVLHVLRAHGRALELLRGDGLPGRGGVVHSYSGSADQVAEYVALGLHVSFAGPVGNPNARKLRAAARAVPRERLLVETDAPFQTPPARRPAACEPAFLVENVAALAQIRGERPEDVAAYTEENARRLFGER